MKQEQGYKLYYIIKLKYFLNLLWFYLLYQVHTIHKNALINPPYNISVITGDKEFPLFVLFAPPIEFQGQKPIPFHTVLLPTITQYISFLPKSNLNLMGQYWGMVDKDHKIFNKSRICSFHQTLIILLPNSNNLIGISH